MIYRIFVFLCILTVSIIPSFNLFYFFSFLLSIFFFIVLFIFWLLSYFINLDLYTLVYSTFIRLDFCNDLTYFSILNCQMTDDLYVKFCKGLILYFHFLTLFVLYHYYWFFSNLTVIIIVCYFYIFFLQ